MLNLDKMPTKVQSNVQEGLNKLTIIDAQEIKTKNGCLALQCSYNVNGTDFKINYDNCIITQKDGSDCNVGQVKLRKILEATGVASVLEGDFTVKMVATLLKGKSFIAPLVKGKPNANGKQYLELSTDFSNYLPVEENKQEYTTPKEANIEAKLFDVKETPTSKW